VDWQIDAVKDRRNTSERAEWALDGGETQSKISAMRGTTEIESSSSVTRLVRQPRRLSPLETLLT